MAKITKNRKKSVAKTQRAGAVKAGPITHKFTRAVSGKLMTASERFGYKDPNEFVDQIVLGAIKLPKTMRA